MHAPAPRLDAMRAGTAIALAAFFMLLISGRSVDLLGSPARIGLILAWLPVAVAAWTRLGALSVIAYLVAGGTLLRWIEMPPNGAGPSDVLAAINEGISVWVGGGNPYDHVYEQTRPPGQPMPYPPGALLLHLPGWSLAGLIGVQWTQFLASVATMGALAWVAARRSWALGLPALALFAGAPNLVLLATDGSNDTATGTLLLAAVLLLGRAASRSFNEWDLAAAGAVAAFALSTKQVVLPVVVALAAYALRAAGWRRGSTFVVVGGALLLAISLPFLILGPWAYVTGLTSFVGVHDDIYGWNVWALAQGMGITPWERGPATLLAMAVAAAVIIGVAIVPLRTIGGAVLAGTLGTLLILFSARWTTYAYFALVAPILLALPVLVRWHGEAENDEAPA